MATWVVELARPPREDLGRISRSLVTSSACGLCGRPSLAGLSRPRVPRHGGEPALSGAMLAALPEALRRQQATFFATGGCHGAALCDREGSVLLAREDVGRHNAVDKLVGAALLRDIPCAGRILVLSGRASFELLQKAAVAGAAVVVAVGAPSSLAVEMAHAAGITLLGFARGQRFNLYDPRRAPRSRVLPHDRGADLYLSPERTHIYVGHFGQAAGTAPMTSTERAQLVAGRGIVGDRYFHRPPGSKGWQVTFFAQEDPGLRLRAELGRTDIGPEVFPGAM